MASPTENLESEVLYQLMEARHLAQNGNFIAINDDDADRYQLSAQFQVISDKIKHLETLLEDRNVVITPRR